jgi:hypothetical protein
MTPRKRGRPTKRTPDVEARIVEAVRAGNYIETAAAYAGIGKSTLYEWQAKYPDFADALQRARAEAEVRDVTLIRQAARTQWQAAAWWLERSFPQRYGRRDKLEVTEAPAIDVSLYTDAELDVLRELLQKGRDDPAVIVQGSGRALPSPA